MHVQTPTAEDLPTPGEVELGSATLALGVASAAELAAFRPHSHEARLAAEMAERRRRDFLVGRLAARRALASLALPAGPVLAAGGRPRFPPPAVGSISHSRGVGVAVAVLGDGAASVGVDVELGRISLRAARGVCTLDELAWAFSASSETARAERATALFSAKESAYKALPAQAQSALRWRDIAISPASSGFTGRVQGTPAEAGIEGGWRLGSAVLTWAICRWPRFEHGGRAI